MDRHTLVTRHLQQVGEADPLIEPRAQASRRLLPIRDDPHVEAFFTVI